MVPILAVSLLVPVIVSGSQAALRSRNDGVFQSLSSKVAALETQLSETELQNKQELAAHQVSYDRKLKEARQANLQLATSNMHLAQEVQTLRNGNVDLRKMATQLKMDGRKWMDDWNTLKGNLTAVLEFTTNTISDYQKADRAGEMSVLEELSNRDRQDEAQQAHRRRFDEIAGTAGDTDSLALLQVSSPQNPKSILGMLESGLDDLNKEKARKEGELLDKFKSLMLAERKRREALVAEAASLKKQKDIEVLLQSRLNAAVHHLQVTNEHLEEQGRSLRMYTQRLGIRPLPHTPSARSVATPLVAEPSFEAELSLAPREEDESPEEASANDDTESTTELARMQEPVSYTQISQRSPSDQNEAHAAIKPTRGLFSWWSR